MSGTPHTSMTVLAATTRHGVDGWTLQEYELDDVAGIGYYLYTRRLPGKEPEERTVERKIACASSHRGWRRSSRSDDTIEN